MDQPLRATGVMTPAQVARRGADYLARHDVASPQVAAELLLASVLGADRTVLAVRTEGLSTAEARSYGRALCRRCTGTPIQHITGETGFRRLMLGVRPGVFIPRPETEVVVETVLDHLRDVDDPLVVDVGTGAGAIALSIVDERPDAAVFAIDRSAEAVSLARANAAHLGLAIEVVLGAFLAPLPAEIRGRAHAVVSNPPYVDPEAFELLPDDVRADPAGALLGGVDGYAELTRQAMTVLRPSGVLVVEIAETDGRAISDLLREAGFHGVRLIRDLSDRDRVVLGQKA